MASDHVNVFTDTSFPAEVLKSEAPVLVDFWAVWCGPCKQIAPMIDAIADQYAGKLKVGKVDVDREPIVAQQLRVTSIPTLVLFKGGKVVWQHVGTVTRPKLEAALAQHLA
ncbi:MAG TPA: thioredoxin [Kofleriaceae bacterium]|nr:thioredoxin [Kofleriaceae bacterium]